MPPTLAVVPLLALTALVPLGALWIERVQLESLHAVTQEGLWAWPKIRENAWGIYPGVVALAAVPPALALLLGCRRVGARWHPARTVWAGVLTIGGAGLVALLLVEWLRNKDNTLVVFAAAVLTALRGPCLLTRSAATPGDRRTQEVVALTIAGVVTLVCGAVAASGHITPPSDTALLGAEPASAIAAARAATQDNTWAIGMLIAAVAHFPLCTAGLRRRGLWALAATVVVPTLAATCPPWVREREPPTPPIADLLPPYESAMEVIVLPP